MSKDKIEIEYIESLEKWQCRIKPKSDKPTWTYYGHGKDKKEVEINCRKEMKRNYDNIGMEW